MLSTTTREGMEELAVDSPLRGVKGVKFENMWRVAFS